MHSMIVVCGSGISIQIDDVTDIFQVVLNLLAAYYVFDLKYPAQYGLLELFDRLLLTEAAKLTSQPKKKKSRGALTTLTKFEKLFSKFLNSEEEKSTGMSTSATQLNNLDSVLESQPGTQDSQFSQDIDSD